MTMELKLNQVSIDTKGVIEMTTFCRQRLNEIRKDPALGFPEPLKVGRSVRWLVSDILQWLQAMKRSNSELLESLVSKKSSVDPKPLKKVAAPEPAEHSQMPQKSREYTQAEAKVENQQIFATPLKAAPKGFRFKVTASKVAPNEPYPRRARTINVSLELITRQYGQARYNADQATLRATREAIKLLENNSSIKRNSPETRTLPLKSAKLRPPSIEFPPGTLPDGRARYHADQATLKAAHTSTTPSAKEPNCLPLPGVPVKEVSLADLKAHYESGQSLDALCKQYRMGKSRLSKLLREMGAQMRQPGRRPRK